MPEESSNIIAGLILLLAANLGHAAFRAGESPVQRAAGREETRHETVWLASGGRLAGAVSRAEGGVAVSWPYGSVVVSPEHIRRRAPVAVDPVSTRPVAWTKGDFRLRYRLSREGRYAVARELRVTVRNDINLPVNPSPELRRHEEVHRRLNELAARRMEKELTRFRILADEDTASLRRAEKALKAEFARLLEQTDKLHKDWDASDPLH